MQVQKKIPVSHSQQIQKGLRCSCRLLTDHGEDEKNTLQARKVIKILYIKSLHLVGLTNLSTSLITGSSPWQIVSACFAVMA